MGPDDAIPFLAPKRRSGQRSGAGQYIDVTFGTPNADQSVPVTLGSKPSLYFVVRRSAAITVYDGSNLGADWTPNAIVLRATGVGSVTLWVR